MDVPLALLIERDLPAAARGDRDAFARLVDATRVVVSSIVLAIVRDADLSRDVAQDVFLAAWRDLRQLRDPRSFLPWLRQLARHRAYHVLRTERRRRRRVTPADTEDLLLAAVDARPSADEALAAREDQRVLAAVLDELPDETREVVTLYYREGQSTAQVAELLGLGEAAVRKRLSRARAALRDTLLERFGTAARVTAPGAVFTGAVMTALSVGAPAAASAATTSSLVASAKSSMIGAIGAIAAAVLVPFAGGAAGVLFGTRQLKRQARSATELVALRRFEMVSLVLVFATAVAFPAGWILTGSRWSPVVTFAVFIAGLAILHAAWLPAIVRERHALERVEDPERARQARARERRAARIGWTFGLILGTAGLVAGLLL
ncbi:MAG: sigma-70 family RNA polymerase sigma factor [Vicinamibacterales bacterium]